jgi:hypothetical protein
MYRQHFCGCDAARVALGRGVRVQTKAAVVAVRAGDLLLWDTVERAGETGSGGHGATEAQPSFQAPSACTFEAAWCN